MNISACSASTCAYVAATASTGSWAIFLVALIGGGIFIVVAYFTQLVHPGGVFDAPDSAAFDIAVMIGGNLFSAVFLAALVIAQFTSGLAAQASGSRLLFAMGRDGELPQRLFGAVHDRFHTPWLSITAVGVVGLLAVFLDVATSTSFINFGAFIAFTAVNIAVIALWWQRRRDGEQLSVVGYVIAPAIGAVIIVTLLVRLDANAVLIGLGWARAGHHHPGDLDQWVPQATARDDDRRGTTRRRGRVARVQLRAGRHRGRRRRVRAGRLAVHASDHCTHRKRSVHGPDQPVSHRRSRH